MDFGSDCEGTEQLQKRTLNCAVIFELSCRDDYGTDDKLKVHENSFTITWEGRV